MNEVNIINYLLLAFFVAGTFYVTVVVAKEVCEDFSRHLRPVKRLMRRWLLRVVHEAAASLRSFSMRVAS